MKTEEEIREIVKNLEKVNIKHGFGNKLYPFCPDLDYMIKVLKFVLEEEDKEDEK